MTRRPNWLARAEERFDERTAPSAGGRKYVPGDRSQATDRGTLRREQQEEAAQSWLSFGSVTDAQFKSSVVGMVIGALVGALVFLPLGLFSWGGLAIGWRFAIAALCGALAGSAAMAVYLGGRGPEVEGETRDVDGPSVGTSPRDPGTDERGRPR